MTAPTPTRQLRDAIEDAMYTADIVHGKDVVSAIAEAVKDFYAARGMHLTREKKSFEELTAAADVAIKEIADMIAEVERALNVSGVIDMGGNGKWEKAIKYLIKVKKDNGWEFSTLWEFVNSEELKYESGRLTYGALMKDPLLVKVWMPRAYAEKTQEETRREHQPFEFD